MIGTLNPTLFDLTGQNIIDSRWLVERLDDIESDLDAIADGDLGLVDDPHSVGELEEEKKLIEEIIEQIEGYSDDTSRDGVALIAEHYFQAYAEDFAYDIGAVSRNADWPLTYIDWERAADALKQDYTSVDIGTTEYWFR